MSQRDGADRGAMFDGAAMATLCEALPGPGGEHVMRELLRGAFGGGLDPDMYVATEFSAEAATPAGDIVEITPEGRQIHVRRARLSRPSGVAVGRDAAVRLQLERPARRHAARRRFNGARGYLLCYLRPGGGQGRSLVRCRAASVSVATWRR